MISVKELPEKREARRFEPPPWEREQFEELARRRADEREKATSAPTSEEMAPAPTGERESDPVSGGSTTTASEKGADPEAFDMMIEALRKEEPEAAPGAWKIGLAAAVLIGTIGLMLVVWGAVALARAGPAGSAGVMGSMIISVMGVLFVALGAWAGLRSLRQRGVL